MYLLSVEIDLATQDILWTLWNGFCLVWKKEECEIIDEEDEVLALLVEVE